MLSLAAWLIRRHPLHSSGEECIPTLALPAEASVGYPFARAIGRWRHLAPRSGTRDAYMRWREYHEHDDPDGYWYEDMCRLMGIEAETPAGLDQTPLVAETVDDVPLLVDASDDDVPSLATVSRAALPTRQQLDVQVASERLVAWVRECGRCGTYTDRDFSDLCAEFFEAEGLEPIADNILRPVLLGLSDDVIKSRTDNGGGRHKRRRNYRWTILEPETLDATEPWVNLPMRERQAA